MLWTIINEQDIFYSPTVSANTKNSVRSSNPYDYIRNGYYLDNGSLFGGKDNVGYKINISGVASGADVDIPNI
ncbi:MAG: hypothetical protein PUE75_03705 [Eubacteriales bacterium]|nr:hypothetical protein [Eubacteriales bacterium]